MGKGFAALGNFTCVDCRLKEMLAEGVSTSVATPQLRALTTKTMILELSQGKETTAGGYSEYTSLEERYVLGLGFVLNGGLRLPRHSVEAFKNFLSWVALDAERARSLQSLVRMASSFFSKLKIPNVANDKSVQAHLKDLLREVGEESEPATAATVAMMEESVRPGGAIDARFQKQQDGIVVPRTKLQFVCEGVGGARLGEAVGGGDGHGLLANNSCILEDPAAPLDSLNRLVVECKLEHSKTGFSRYLDMTGKTATSGIPCAQILQDYWKAMGLSVGGKTLTTAVHAGIRVTRPDFWVVRISMLSLDAEGLGRLLRFIGSHSSPLVRRFAGSSVTDASSRYHAASAESQAKRYVNVAASYGSDPSLDQVRVSFESAGFEASVVPGPLLLATTGGTRGKLKLMPFQPGSASSHTKEILGLAAEAVTKRMGSDPDLETQPGRAPKWSTHSLRRLADTVARKYRDSMSVSESEIDIYFGWHERVLLKEMQVHYEALSPKERMLHARITGMM